MMTCEQENTDKILSCIADCRSHDITVLPPDVNQSEQDFTIADAKQIRFGLGAVKNVGAGAIESIVQSRAKDGPFTSLYDFCRRIDSRRVNKRVIESLAKCGAFDFTGAPRSQLFGNIDRAMNMASSHQRDRQTGQARLFDTITNSAANVDDDSLEPVPVWNEQAMLSYEKEALGFYISGHPLTQFDDLLKIYATEDTASLIEISDKKEVRLGGVNARMREITTRKGKRMAFMTLEDLHGMVEVIVFADVYSETIELLKSDKPLFVAGTAESDGETVKVIAAQIFPLDEVQKHFTKSVHFFVSTTKLNQAHLAELKTLLRKFPGSSPGYVHLLEPKKVETVLSLPPELNMTASAELSLAVEKVFGEDITRYIAI